MIFMKIRHLDTRRGITVIDDFLSQQECQEAIARSEAAGFAAAPITTALGPRMAPGVRNNTRVMIDDIPLAHALWSRLEPALPALNGWVPVGLNERFRFYRYARGERFNWHHDGAYVRSPYVRSRLSLLFYLSGDFTGGQTQFADTHAELRDPLSIQPRAGMALFFPHPLLHTGAEVISGVKYVMRSDVMYAL
jgi:predicted 2-oxoglutarate/Fe(II)-dependent dioxygenase YbiX